jgi:molybdopterin converting factor small subunit
MVNVKVLFIGKVQEYAGEEMAFFQLPDSADVGRIFQELTLQKPAINEVAKFLFISVNDVMSPRNRILKNGDEVKLFFRMGGG